jgi:hypothetical protein
MPRVTSWTLVGGAGAIVAAPVNQPSSLSPTDSKVAKKGVQAGFGDRQAMGATEARFVRGLEHLMADVVGDRAEAGIQGIQDRLSDPLSMTQGMNQGFTPGLTYLDGRHFPGPLQFFDRHNALSLGESSQFHARSQFQFRREPSQPSYQLQHAADRCPLPPPLEQDAQEPDPFGVARLGVPLCGQRDLVSGDQQREWIACLVEDPCGTGKRLLGHGVGLYGRLGDLASFFKFPGRGDDLA